ncbi:hypothetical protein [Fortiea contorta]|nr:hypothetical protein [Fortiea contorta]
MKIFLTTPHLPTSPSPHLPTSPQQFVFTSSITYNHGVHLAVKYYEL